MRPGADVDVQVPDTFLPTPDGFATRPADHDEKEAVTRAVDRAHRLRWHLLMEHPNSALRYVTADRVDTPAGRLSKTIVVNASNDTLGKLDGIVVDPIRRKLRGYVVESPEWLSSKRYFVPLVMARLDRDHDTLELGVGSEDVDHFDEVDLQAFPPFSEDDLLTALFYARPDEGD